MTETVRNINQRYWSSKSTPHLTIRTTDSSLQSYKAHSHSELSIGILLSGSTCLTLPTGQTILHTGDSVIIEPNMVHACNPIGEFPRSYYMLYVDTQWCCQVLSALYGYRVNQFTCDQSLLSECEFTSELIKTVCSLLEHKPQPFTAEKPFISEKPSISEKQSTIEKQPTDEKRTALQMDHHLFHLLSRFCSPSHHQEEDDGLAVKVKSRLLEDISVSLSLDTVSQEFGRPTESLIRSFKRRFGITPKAFLNNHRVEKAKVLLKSGMNIVDVATEVGFSDQSQLHRVFVNYTASTPRQYQQVASIFDNNC